MRRFLFNFEQYCASVRRNIRASEYVIDETKETRMNPSLSITDFLNSTKITTIFFEVDLKNLKDGSEALRTRENLFPK